MCTLNSQAVSACVSTSPKDFLQIHSTSHLMRFRVAYGSHRQKNKHNANAKWFNLHREHTRILSHGVAVQRTLKILFAFSCNNQPSLALKLTPTPHLLHTSPAVWLIQAGHLVDFHRLMKTVRASLLSCCVSNCQLPHIFSVSKNVSGNLLGLSSYYHTRWMHFTATFLRDRAEIRPAESIGMPPVYFMFCWEVNF